MFFIRERISHLSSGTTAAEPSDVQTANTVVIPNARAAGGGICCYCDVTDGKQIPPRASPSFGMTDEGFALISRDGMIFQVSGFGQVLKPLSLANP